ncbi:MAG: hypothetical protein V4801_02545 [Burkholderia gladioli]
MGYTLTIGNVDAGELICEDGRYEVCMHIVRHERKDAPRDGSPTDRTNQRWPSYGIWTDFCRLTGLHEMFFEEYEGLLSAHPGVFELRPAHLIIIKRAHERLKEGDPEIYAEHRGRMEWLEYWTEWALSNCERPAIQNS